MKKHAALLILAAAALSAAYTYYYGDNLTTVDGTKWYTNGTVSAGTGGLTISGSGSLISKVAVPDGTSEYEVKAKLTLGQSGGIYTLYLRATNDALAGSPAQGTFYAAELWDVQINGSSCTAQLALLKSVAGSVTWLTNGYTSCRSGMEIRLVRAVSGMAIFVDNRHFTTIWDTSIASGKPGIGGRSMPAANSIARVDLGPLDRVAPGAVNPQQTGSSVFSNRVDMQWPGTPDDANGVGFAHHSIVRNGSWWAIFLANGFSDAAVSPATNYTYTIYSEDFHLNSAATTITVTTPPAGAIDPRRIGLRGTGSYWGEGKEQIDLLSGNLNYTMPLLKAQARGWGVGFSLNYNSQNWRQDPGGIWNLGRDVGFGYGWKLLAGTIRAFNSDYWTTHHITFTDATGAEYLLDVWDSTARTFKSRDGSYLTYAVDTGLMYFRDGTYWQFWARSDGAEQDAGTWYPTMMQDTNGNRIYVSYQAGIGVGWSNSSGRISQITDVRGNYNFTYSTTACSGDPIPRLTQITNTFGSGERYDFGYLCNQAFKSPFAATSYGTATLLQTVTSPLTSLTQTFQYDAGTSGELTKVTLPYGGYFRWAYQNFTFNGSRTQREVATRYLSKSGSGETTYTINRDAGDVNLTVHSSASLLDPSGVSEKKFFFSTDTGVPWRLGLQTSREDRKLPGPVTMVSQTQTWVQDANGNPYIGTALVTQDPGQSYQAQKKTEQTLDVWGNLTQVKLYDINSLTTPLRTYTNTYLSSSNYTSRHIRNRLLTSAISDGTTSITLVTNT